MTMSMMSILFFALAAIGLIALYYLVAQKDTGKMREVLAKASQKAHFHQMLGMVIIVAHASEIGRVITHLSFVHLLLALFLFALWLATRYDSAPELA